MFVCRWEATGQSSYFCAKGVESEVAWLSGGSGVVAGEWAGGDSGQGLSDNEAQRVLEKCGVCCKPAGHIFAPWLLPAVPELTTYVCM